MNELSALIIIFSLIIIIFLYFQSYGSLTYVVSSIDNNKYLVRNESDKDIAANILAKLNNKVLNFIDQLLEIYKNDNKLINSIERLYDNYDPKSISENYKYSNSTSYSINKGEKIVLCLRQKNNTFVDDNTLMFVITHELAHLMSESIGHTDEFWSNFKFLLDNAEDLNIYDPIDYSKKNQEYCGMDILDNPQFNKNI